MKDIIRKQINHIYKKDGKIYIKCLVSDDYIQMIFYCPLCKKMHYHGNCDGNGAGHRISHCPNNNFEDGYILEYDKCIDKEKNLYETEVLK